MTEPEEGPSGLPEVATESTKVVTPPRWDAAKRSDLEAVKREVADLHAQIADLQTISPDRGSVALKQAIDTLSKTLSEHTFSPMDMQPERDRTDAMIAAAEARTDTKFAQTNAKLDALLTEVRGSRSDGKTTRTVITTTMIGSVLALAALMYALVSYGATQFYNGTTIYDHLHPAVTEPVAPAK